MTPANVKRSKDLAEHFRTLAKENPDAPTGMYAMLKASRMIGVIMDDLHFRPEANK